ncbi:protein-L-isoaspartate O-methyltransferase [Sphingomonas sp.]|uniref:protein-L-isoaspartate O-methyltransferase family protein n=1 Tax=Sphingomonas sp. TaxID=28214 RepID=UPI00286D0094|nr:protein-L-isoaspartate O-methyltransferase [Sphingomonas sp.]
MANPATDSAAARRLMVLSQLRPQGVTDAAVLAAMTNVAREDYLPENFAAIAYGDRPIRLADGSPVMAPAELGQLLTQLAPKPGQRALVIGGGGDYSAAVLGHIGLTVDRAQTAEDALTGSFDLILIEGAVEHVSASLARCLAPNGRIGTAIVEDGVTRLATGRGHGKSLGFTSFAEAQVPLLASFSQAPAFTF